MWDRIVRGWINGLMDKRGVMSIASKRHYFGLALAIGIGVILRFGNLDLKPLWLDEIITALFALGRQTSDIPLDRLFSRLEIDSLFTLDPTLSCPQIARTVATESTHPPLFFCLMHRWSIGVGGVSPSHSLAWLLRSLPALFGVGAIVASYFLNRLAFSPAAGFATASLAAVSPFCVYLSQESRHYTLPLLLITLALIGLVQIIQAWDEKRRVPPRIWVGWVAVNSLGLYVHYFFVLAFAAQIATLLSFGIWRKRRLDAGTRGRGDGETRRRGDVGTRGRGDGGEREGISGYRTGYRRFAFRLGFPFIFSGLPILFFLPWLPTLLGHFRRSETDWFKPFEPSWTDGFAPIYQTLAGWLLMVVSFPVEDCPLWIAIPSGVLMVGFAIWLGRWVWQGLRGLWRSPQTQRSTFIFAAFTIWVLLEILAIVYLLDKDITAAPRYHFIYYPGVGALLGASLDRVSSPKAEPFPRKLPKYSPLSIAFAVGLLSSILTIGNFVFHKPYYPDRIAEQMTFDRTLPLVMVVGYENLQEAALGLSFALELEKRQTVAGESDGSKMQYAFLDRSAGYEALWQNLSQLQPLPELPFNLWIVGPGLRQAAYPDSLVLSSPAGNLPREFQCDRDFDRYYRLGIPYQLYVCSQAKTSLSTIDEARPDL
ncbi:MAG: glycosyltransferase family 39 protein [Cyanobacteriota bacterium]|nr:glycosyltransferase family 39 protein [Cyanobacteriota bacterium]